MAEFVHKSKCDKDYIADKKKRAQTLDQPMSLKKQGSFAKYKSKFAHISKTSLPTPYVFCDIRAIQAEIYPNMPKKYRGW